MSTGRYHPNHCDNHCKFFTENEGKIYCRLATAGKDLRYTNFYNGEIPSLLRVFLESVGCASYEREEGKLMKI